MYEICVECQVSYDWNIVLVSNRKFETRKQAKEHLSNLYTVPKMYQIKRYHIRKYK